MNATRKQFTVHLPGTLSANATGVIPMWDRIGGTLLEVAACSSNAGAATLMLGVRGTSPDADGIMTPKAIGVSKVPVIFQVADFDGRLADPMHTTCPLFAPKTVLTWTIDYDGSGVNEVQLVTINNGRGGTFTLTYAGQTTAAIAYNAAAAAVQAALVALSNIEAGDVVVTGSAGGPYTLTFGGALAEANVAEVTATITSLTGVNAIQVVTLTGVPTGGDFTLTYIDQTTTALAFDITAADLATALKALSNIGPTDVTVTGDVGGPFTVEFVTTMGSQPIVNMAGNGAGLTGGTNPAITVEATQVGITPTAVIATTLAGAAPGTAAANIDLVFTVLLGGVVSGVTGF